MITTRYPKIPPKTPFSRHNMAFIYYLVSSWMPSRVDNEWLYNVEPSNSGLEVKQLSRRWGRTIRPIQWMYFCIIKLALLHSLEIRVTLTINPLSKSLLGAFTTSNVHLELMIDLCYRNKRVLDVNWVEAIKWNFKSGVYSI